MLYGSIPLEEIIAASLALDDLVKFTGTLLPRDTCASAHTHMDIYTRMRTNSHTHTQMCRPATHSHAYTLAHTYTHTHTHAHTHTHTSPKARHLSPQCYQKPQTRKLCEVNGLIYSLHRFGCVQGSSRVNTQLSISASHS